MTDVATPTAVAPDTASPEAGDKIFRVPDDPGELLDLQEELTKENANIDARITRAVDQKNNNIGRLARIQEKLDGLGDIKIAVNAKLKTMEETAARLRAKFGL